MSKIKFCKNCQRVKIYKAKGLCEDCYNKQYRKNHKKQIKQCSKQYIINHPIIGFLSKSVSTNLPKPNEGIVRHHEAYCLNDPDKHVIFIPISLHVQLHQWLKKNNIELEIY